MRLSTRRLLLLVHAAFLAVHDSAHGTKRTRPPRRSAWREDSGRSAYDLGRVKTFSCKRSELDEVATRAIFPDFDYALIAAISG
jgi:hypothetical protein